MCDRGPLTASKMRLEDADDVDPLVEALEEMVSDSRVTLSTRATLYRGMDVQTIPRTTRNGDDRIERTPTSPSLLPRRLQRRTKR